MTDVLEQDGFGPRRWRQAEQERSLKPQSTRSPGWWKHRRAVAAATGSGLLVAALVSVLTGSSGPSAVASDRAAGESVTGAGTSGIAARPASRTTPSSATGAPGTGESATGAPGTPTAACRPMDLTLGAPIHERYRSLRTVTTRRACTLAADALAPVPDLRRIGGEEVLPRGTTLEVVVLDAVDRGGRTGCKRLTGADRPIAVSLDGKVLLRASAIPSACGDYLVVNEPRPCIARQLRVAGVSYDHVLAGEGAWDISVYSDGDDCLLSRSDVQTPLTDGTAAEVLDPGVAMATRSRAAHLGVATDDDSGCLGGGRHTVSLGLVVGGGGLTAPAPVTAAASSAGVLPGRAGTFTTCRKQTVVAVSDSTFNESLG